jgi:hypothetical protein
MTKEEAIQMLVNATYSDEWQGNEDLTTAHNMAIKSLEAWDKVIEEIKEQFDGCDICEWFEDYDWDENNISEYRYIGSVDDILDIIRKHLGELFYIQRNMGRN